MGRRAVKDRHEIDERRETQEARINGQSGSTGDPRQGLKGLHRPGAPEPGAQARRSGAEKVNSPPVTHRSAPDPAPIANAPARVPLLGRGDPAPFVVLHENGAAPVLFVCDHASRAIPAQMQRLGLAELQSWQHIAWDIGAGELARGLAHAVDAPAVLAGYSRLVVDCNRSPEDPEAFRQESDGWKVPANQDLTEYDRRLRLGTFFDPYHDCIGAMLAGFRMRNIVPLLVAVHSFAPRLGDAVRPWQVGVLWDMDERNARRLLEGLAAEWGLQVGDNEPYSGKHPANYTIDRHAKTAGIPHVCIEVRQDQLESPAGVERWVRLLSRQILSILAEPDSRELLHARSAAWRHLSHR
jgi:predicted N-formylglutamate amidohydrolase